MTSKAPIADIVRCSACGHPIDEPTPPRCPLCNAPLLQEPEDGADVTPYAAGFAKGEPARASMNQWVWFAGWHRLTHMALMRASAASRTFARGNAFLMAGCLAAFAFFDVGWRLEPIATDSPSGAQVSHHVGWVRLVEAGVNAEAGTQSGQAFDLWWSPIQSGFAAVHAFILGLVICVLTMWLLRMAMLKVQGGSGAETLRMTAALHYASAWIVPLIPATVVVSLRPLAYMGQAGPWSWYPSVSGLKLAAAVVGVFAFVMWWFWLFRIGTASPARTRGRVVAFFAIGAPAVVVLTGFVWYIAVDAMNQMMFRLMRVTF